MAFVIGHLVDFVKEVFQQGRVRFFANKWNYFSAPRESFTASYFKIPFLLSNRSPQLACDLTTLKDEIKNSSFRTNNPTKTLMDTI